MTCGAGPSSVRKARWSTRDGSPRNRTPRRPPSGDRKSTRLNSSHLVISYAVFCLEKNSNFVMLVTVPRQATAPVVAALSQHSRQLPATLRRALTGDRGLDMAHYFFFNVATDPKVFFFYPQSPFHRA